MKHELMAAYVARLWACLPNEAWRAARDELAEVMAAEPAEDAIEFAALLWETGHNLLMQAGVVVIYGHPTALKRLRVSDLERIGQYVDSWGDVDTLCCLTNTLWRTGQLSDATLRRWARSESRWWRRSALVTLIMKPPKKSPERKALIKVRGGHHEPGRMLPFCEMLLDDRDDMVEKAMSWVLRELAIPHPGIVRQFLVKHEDRLAARVLREVGNKLETGVKNPKGGRGKKPVASSQ